MQKRQTFLPGIGRQCFMSEAHSKFFKGGHQIVTSFMNVINLKQIEEKKALEGPEACSPENFCVE